MSVAGSEHFIGDCRRPDPNPDWAKLGAYRADNERVRAAPRASPRVVLMGDSITEFWDAAHWQQGHINRGISGQTTPQMLLRFRSDVIELQPDVVVILAGTNDIAGNTGPISEDGIVGNIASMVELARFHRIRVVLCAVLPVALYPWSPQVERPAERIRALNLRLAALARQHDLVFLDYHSAMTDARGGLPTALADDGVHPNAFGYARMAALREAALAKALQQQP